MRNTCRHEWEEKDTAFVCSKCEKSVPLESNGFTRYENEMIGNMAQKKGLTVEQVEFVYREMCKPKTEEELALMIFEVVDLRKWPAVGFQIPFERNPPRP